MRNPSREPQPPSWRGIVVTIYRGIRGGRNVWRNARKARIRWIAGGLLCVALAAGISLVALARERSAKRETPSAATASSASEKGEPASAKGASRVKSAKAETAVSTESNAATPRDSNKAEPAFPNPQVQATQTPGSAQTSEQDLEEGPEVLRERAEWFYRQRAYPLGHIPAGVRQRAIEHRKAMEARQSLIQTGAAQQSAAAVSPGSSPGSPLTTPPITFPGPANFTPIGPQPINPSFVTGPNFGNPSASGRIDSIAIDPNDATHQTLYLAAADGGVWKTTNAGTTWAPLTDSQASLSMGAVQVSPVAGHGNIIYAATGEQNSFGFDNYFGAGVLKSTDGGSTWTQTGTPAGVPFVGPFSGSSFSNAFFGGAHISSVAINPSNDSLVLVGVQFGGKAGVDPPGTSSGVYCTDNGGTTWSQIASASTTMASYVGYASSTVAYAGIGYPQGDANNGIYVSSNADGGASKLCSSVTFTQPTGTGLPAQASMGRIILGLPQNDPLGQTAYAAIANSSGGSTTLLAFVKTTNGGSTWTTQTPAASGFCNNQCWYDMAVGVDPSNPNNVAVGGSAFTNNSSTVWLSTNGGTSWTDITTGATAARPHVDTHSIIFVPGTTTLFTGDDGGVWSTANYTASPVTWTGLNSSLQITQHYPGLSISRTDENKAYSGAQDNGTDAFTGSSAWTNVACGDGGFTAIDAQFDTTVYAACQNISIVKSYFDGAPGTFISSPTTGIGADRHSFISPLVQGPAPGLLYFGTFKVYQSTNSGNLWTSISPDLTRDGASFVETIAAAASNPDIVYAGTGDGQVWRTTNATSGSGAIWTNLTKAPLPPRFITSIWVDDSDPNIAWVAFSGFSGFGDTVGHLFQTADGGATWTDISCTAANCSTPNPSDLPNTPVNEVKFASNSNTLFVGTDVGVFSSTVGSGTWSIPFTGLPHAVVLSLNASRRGDIGFVATHGRGTWIVGLPRSLPTGAFLTSISPSSASAGASGFTMTLGGANFTASSAVLWDGAANGITTTFLSANQLTAMIPTALLTVSGQHSVTVSDPAGGSKQIEFNIMAPRPSLSFISPISGPAGAGVTITATGSGFVTGTQLVFNGTLIAGTVSGGTTLTANVPATLVTASGNVFVDVFSPQPGGGNSGNSQVFNITIAAPSITSLNPSSVGAGGPGFLLTVNGSNFASNAFVTVGGTSEPVTYVNSGQLLVSVPSTKISLAGSNPAIVVFDPVTGGPSLSSNSVNLTVTSTPNPVPTISSLSPSSVAAGSNFTLTVINTDSSYVGNSAVRVNGAAVATTFVDAMHLSASVPSGDVATPGPVPITVFNPAPPTGGQTSAPFNLTVTGAIPTIASLSPNSAIAGSPAGNMSVTGTNFDATAVVKWAGTALTTSFITSTQLVAAVPASNLINAGSFAVTVTNSSGTSAPSTFTVIPNGPAVAFSPANIAFGSQIVGTTSATISATLTNIGNVNLNITGVSITGANAADFTSSGTTCTSTTVLAPTQSCTLGAKFTPGASGIRTAAFTITDNASGSPHSLPLSGAGTHTPGFAYVANQNSGTVSAYTINAANGALTPVGTGSFTSGTQPTSVMADPSGLCLYVANQQDSVTPIAVFTINPTTGALTPGPTPPVSLQETSPTSIAIDPTGKFAYIANFSGNVSMFTINSSTCALTRIAGSPVTAGTLANFATIDPSGKFLYVTNFGDNTISGYTINSSTGSLTPIVGSPFAAGSGPMSVSVDPTGQFAFETSTDSSVLVYSINSGAGGTGALTQAGSAPTGGASASVTVEPSGRFVYAGDGGTTPGNVDGYSLNSSSGALTALTPVNQFPTQNTPQSVTVDASGRFVYVANNGSTGVSAFQINNSTGALAPLSPTAFFPAGGGPYSVTTTVLPSPSGPGISFSPANVAFGNQKVGTTSATNNVTITNNGTATLNITGITLAGANPGDFTLGAPTTGTACPLGASALTAGSNCAVGVAFKPTATGARSASVSVADNASGSPQTVPLTGTGTVPVASLAPANIAFGNQTINTTSATNNVTVSNTGQASMNITSITLTGTNPAQFALVAPTIGTACPLGASVLNAGSNCTVGVQFAPTALASDSANVSVADAAAGSPQTVPLTGTGVSAPAPAVTLSPTSIAFGNQKVGTTSAAMSATLTNTGNANLNITAVSITGANGGDFNSSGTTCTGSTVLTPTQSCTLGATFTPAASGARSAAFSISDTASGSPHSLPLSGTGTVPGVGLAPANIAFGNQAVSTTSATNNITLTNSGNATLNITSITLTGTNPGQFTLGAPTTGTVCPLGASSLAAGSACSVGVKFAPTATGPFTANVSFADDASGSPQTVGLTGTGTAPAVTFAPANVAFGNQRTGTSSVVANVTITNSGTATLNITGITLTGTNPGDFSLGAPTTGTACALGASSLNAGSNCAVGVAFKPTATGARSANVSVADNASGSPQTVALTGTGIASAVTFAPVSVVFGNQRTGTTSAVTNVTLTNSGTATLNITGITLTGTNPGDFSLGAPTTGTACALGASSLTVSSSCAVGVTFKPTATGAKSANISVADDAPGSPQTVALTGTGTASAVTLAPTNVPFGNQVVSTQSAVTNVMITNGGTATLNITSITLTGTNPGDFSLGAPTTGTACGLGASSLNAGSNCSFGVSFGPTATGARSASVSIADDASGSPQTVALTGTGTAANVTLSPSPVNFSNQRINTSSGTNTVTLSNTGNATVTLAASNAVTITGTNAGDFAIVAATGTNCSNNLVVAATNGTCVIGVTFTPTATGPRTATLQVSDNATPGTQSVILNGTGTVPTASVAPLNIPFGNQRKGTTSAGTDVTVSNTGTDTLNIATVALTGANPSQFTLGAPSTGTPCSLAAATAVAPGSNCKFSVKFAPTVTGAQAASVTITDDSGAVAGTVQTATLTGTGTLPQASAAPNPLAFGNQRKGTTSGAKTVTLTNTGTDTLNLAAANSVVISGANAADFAIVAASTTCKNSGTVAPNGSTCVINITFAPTTTAAEVATLTITDDSGGGAGTTQVVSLTGTGVLPQAGAAPPTLAFGNQPKGITSAPMTVTLTNNGTDTLNLAASNAVAVSGTNAADFAAVTATTTCTNGAAIAASTSCVVNITFAPSTTAAESATLTITDDSGGVAGSSQTVSLTGTGTTATINLTPNPVPFGNQRKGTPSSAQTITVTNSGNGSVTLAASNAVALSGANVADFAITGGTCANNLVLAAAPGAGNTCTITATFTPSTAAAETATVTVSFQGSTPAALDTLNGTGIFPSVTLTPNTPLSFGNQIITTTSATQSVTLKNAGTDTLNLSSANAVALGGANAAEFTTTGTTCANSQAIPVNGTCNIVVALSPATAGAKSATVTVTDDVSPAQVINLSGTGVTPPTATLSAATLTFAAQHTGTTSAAQSVTVTNSGGADLNIATVAISGTNASDFATATGTTCTNGSTVNGGASNRCLINVTFTPSAVGARTATITITDNADATGAPGAAQTITLSGTGKAPAITFAPASVPNFGNQRIGTASAATTVTITNSGTDTLNFTSITITGTNASEFTVAGSGATPCPTGAGSLNATLSCTIAITFKPTATGPRSASVNVTDDASGSPQSLALAGIGTAPVATLSAASITFPTTAVNSTSAVQSATVTNSGTATLTLGATAVAISGANAGDFAVAAGTTCTNGAAVAVSANCMVNFTFKPTAAGVRNATATITDDAGGVPGSSTTQTITLSGSTPSTAALSSSTVAFGNQGVGVASSAQTITITNNGGAKLNLAAANAVAISGTNPSDFAVASGTTCTNGASVSGSGGTCIINLTFTPGAIGARGPATVTITDDAGGVANSTQTVTLTGTGIDFTLAVTAGSQTVKAGSPATFTLTVTPGGGGFPNAITFTTSALPRGAMGAFNPSTLAAPITAQQTITLTISTTSRGAAPPLPAAPRVPPFLIFRLLTVLFALLALLIMRRGLRTRRLASCVPLVLLLAALAVSAGCVGGNANGTPPGTTQVTVTATAGSLTHTTTVSLTVN